MSNALAGVSRLFEQLNPAGFSLPEQSLSSSELLRPMNSANSEIMTAPIETMRAIEVIGQQIRERCPDVLQSVTGSREAYDMARKLAEENSLPLELLGRFTLR